MDIFAWDFSLCSIILIIFFLRSQRETGHMEAIFKMRALQIGNSY